MGVRGRTQMVLRVLLNLIANRLGINPQQH